MICYASLCVYNEDEECRLGEITINELGMCDDYIIPEIPKDVLESCKKDAMEHLMDDDF